MKKIIKIAMIILIVLIAMWIMAFGIDYYRCLQMKEPIFVLKSEYLVAYSDGRRDLIGQGLGYNIAYNTLPDNNEEEVIWVRMEILNKCILEKRKEIENELYTKKAVIVKVDNKSLSVMGTQGETDLYNFGFSKEGNIRI